MAKEDVGWPSTAAGNKRLPFPHDLPVDPDVARDDPDRVARHSRSRPDAPAGPPDGPPERNARRIRAGVLAAIAAGGALGAPARYEVIRLIHVTKGTFPWATFWTNISGSLVLGFVLVLLIERFPPNRYLRPFVATGFLGAYTTFSTFMVEIDTLAKDGHVGVSVAYLVASTVAGLAAVWAGIMGGSLFLVRQSVSDGAR